MRISLKYALWLLAALPLMQGCDKKQAQVPSPQVLAPPIVDAPPPKPATVSTADLPPPVIGPAPTPDTTAAAAKPAEPPKKVVHKKKPASPPVSSPAPTQDVAKVETPAAPATVPATPGVSAIGTLSGGSPGNSRSETEDTINNTEKGVNAITRTLSDSEVKTAAQIREFLKQAREALTTGDVDGAHTLAMKAKVLLTELNQ